MAGPNRVSAQKPTSGHSGAKGAAMAEGAVEAPVGHSPWCGSCDATRTWAGQKCPICGAKDDTVKVKPRARNLAGSDWRDDVKEWLK